MRRVEAPNRVSDIFASFESIDEAKIWIDKNVDVSYRDGIFLEAAKLGGWFVPKIIWRYKDHNKCEND